MWGKSRGGPPNVTCGDLFNSWACVQYDFPYNRIPGRLGNEQHKDWSTVQRVLIIEKTWSVRIPCAWVLILKKSQLKSWWKRSSHFRYSHLRVIHTLFHDQTSRWQASLVPEGMNRRLEQHKSLQILQSNYRCDFLSLGTTEILAWIGPWWGLSCAPTH